MRDADALEPLLAVMTAAGAHDEAAASRGLHAAAASLGNIRHAAHRDINAAHLAVTLGRWTEVWARAYGAICALVWTFPPDASTCPPVPGPVPHRALPCGCGETIPPAGRFCPACGAAAAPRVGS